MNLFILTEFGFRLGRRILPVVVVKIIMKLKKWSDETSIKCKPAVILIKNSDNEHDMEIRGYAFIKVSVLDNKALNGKDIVFEKKMSDYDERFRPFFFHKIIGWY